MTKGPNLKYAIYFILLYSEFKSEHIWSLPKWNATR